jgi:hypothetical protein
VATIAVAAALALAACGSDSSSSEPATTRPAATTTGAAGNNSEAKARARERASKSRLRASILGYGKAGTEAEAKAAAVPLSAYFRDREIEYWPAACSYLSTAMRLRMKQIGGGGEAGCGKGIEAATTERSTSDGEATIMAIKGIRREGRRGFLIYRTEAGETNAMPMVLEAGEWKVDGVNPTLLFS